jgi:hypothetical protein
MLLVLLADGAFFFLLLDVILHGTSTRTGATTTRVWAFYSLMALVLLADGACFFAAGAPFFPVGAITSVECVSVYQSVAI